MESIQSFPYHYKKDPSRLDRLLKQCENFVQWDFNLNEIPTDPNLSRYWINSHGETLAVAIVDRPVSVDDLFLRFAVHPQVRGSVEKSILTWAQSLATRLNSDKPRLGCHACSQDLQRNQLLENQDFQRESSFDLVYMGCSLQNELPELCLPAGYSLRPFAIWDDLPAWLSLFRLTQECNLTPAERITWQSYPSYSPRLDQVVIASDGALAAYCLSNLFLGEQGEIEDDSAWVLWLGTAPAYRRQGLARSLLLSALYEFQSLGCPNVFLYTWPGNESVIRLNQSLGFERLYQMLYYSFS